jgi:predicted phage tail protein
MANWTLTWNSSELPAGTYAGTVVAKNSTGGTAESAAVNFTIATKEIPIKVVKNQAFNIKLGDANVINLAGCALPYTASGVTISNTSNVLYASNSSGGIAADTTITCGGTNISAKVVTPALPTITTVNLY